MGDTIKLRLSSSLLHAPDLLDVRIVLQHIHRQWHPHLHQLCAEEPIRGRFLDSVQSSFEVLEGVPVALREEGQVAPDQRPHEESVEDTGRELKEI